MSTGPSLTPPPPAPVQQKSSAGKIILWIVGIIGSFILICVIGVVALGMYGLHKVKQAGFDTSLMKKNPVYASAKMGATMNKDVEIIASDDNAGSLTVRDKRTGKTTTMRFDAANNKMVITDEKGQTSTITTDGNAGSVSVQGPDGTVKIGAGADKAPNWVPQYPGSNPQNTYSANEQGKQSGIYTFTTADSSEKVLGYYADQLTSGGMQISRMNSSSGGKNTGMVHGQDKDGSHTVVVTSGEESDGTHVSVTYEEKKGGA
jgi:YD repeat-containing protein